MKGIHRKIDDLVQKQTEYSIEKGWSNICDSPSLIARTTVQSITVGILWATVITVQSANSVWMVFWRIMSVALSIDAVASSSTNILKVVALNRKVAAAPCSNLTHIPQLLSMFFVDKDQNLKTQNILHIKKNIDMLPNESRPFPLSWRDSCIWHFRRTFKWKMIN